MSRSISKLLFVGYWLTLVVMIVISVAGSRALIRSDDLRVYLMASSIAPYNTNWVTVIRNRDKPDITALMVNVPGTDDKTHMRFIEYATSDLANLVGIRLKASYRAIQKLLFLVDLHTECW